MGDPMPEATEAPLGAVLLVDGTAGKPACENGLNLGLFVEPLEDWGGALTIEQAMVDLVANGLGETGDFADTGDVGLGRRVPGRGRVGLWWRVSPGPPGWWRWKKRIRQNPWKPP